MGLLDRLLGREPRSQQVPQLAPKGSATPGPVSTDDPFGEEPAPVRTASATGTAAQDDEHALARYRYLLRTAPPEQVEQAHAEAFAQLTADQRRQVLEQLATVTPAEERHGDDPRSLARTATRAEARRPGTLERVFGGAPGFSSAPGIGSAVGAGIGGSLLAGVAGAFVGTALADALVPDDPGDQRWGDDRAHDEGADDGGTDEGGLDSGGFDGGGLDGGDLGV